MEWKLTLLPQLGLSLLDGSHDHVSSGRGRKPVESGSETNNGDDLWWGSGSEVGGEVRGEVDGLGRKRVASEGEVEPVD